MDDRHEGDIIPKVDDRKYAYHDENSYPGTYIRSYPSERGTDIEERKKYEEYEFTITKHTDNSMTVKLRKYRRDIVAQRKANGKAVIYEDYMTIISFGELINRIFGPGCEVYPENEHFPDEVAEFMKKLYDQGGK